MTAFVFFICKSAGEGGFKGDSTLLIHYKIHRQPPSCIVKFLKILCSVTFFGGN
jgi:hypothetical protein